jgi:hypothetical protein
MTKPRRSAGAISRRHILRGTGVALALPWLPSLEPRLARAQSTTARRFISLYLPNGASTLWWKTTGSGTGDAWQLSPLLSPFEAVKSKMLLVRQLGNFTWRRDLLTMQPGWTTSRERNDFCGVCAMPSGAFVLPAHSRDPAALLNCSDGDGYRADRGIDIANSGENPETVDQLIARSVPQETPLSSMQLGLFDGGGFLDERHSALSRNMSWSESGTPLGKDLEPTDVFDSLVAAGAGGASTDEAMLEAAARRRALDQSALDALGEGVRLLEPRLGQDDRGRLDQFLTGVRELENKVNVVVEADPACELSERPQNVSEPLLRAETMNDLLVMALKCDVTRIATYMLDNSRSDLVYNWVPRRDYEDNGADVGGTATSYHESQHHTGTSPDFASITRFHIEVAADLLQKMDAVQEGAGEEPTGTLLDNSLVQFASDMHHGDHAAFDLPFALFGSGGGVFRQNELVMFPEPAEDIVQLRDVYFTMLNQYFELELESFGDDLRGLPNRILSELLV